MFRRRKDADRMKIITAVGNPLLNDKLRKIENINVIGKDIQYQEGILEILEVQNDIDMIIISNLLPEEINFKKLISEIIKIKNEIEIIVILDEKNDEIEYFLSCNKIYKIYYLNNNEIDCFFEEIISKIFNKNTDILNRNN